MKPLATRILLGLCVFCVILQGCTYHGKIHRGIYKRPDFQEKINARVMVVSDKYYPMTMTLENAHQFNFRMSDGLPVAVADALGTLFTEVDVNEYRYRKNYDYIAEIDYEAKIVFGGAEYHFDYMLSPEFTFTPKLTTLITLTMRNPQTGYAVARYSEKRENFLPRRDSDTGLWLAHFFKIITLGILSPLEYQIFGSKVRKMLEKGIVDTLSKEIMPDMADDRFNFTKEHETEKTNIRVDGKFIPFMQSVVYIYDNSGLGSGFLISPDGYIITNRHVVEDSRDVSVVLYDKRHLLDKTHFSESSTHEKADNKVLFGKVLKTNKKRDLALIKIEGENLPYLELETDRAAYVTGQEVVAIGAPQGIEWTASQGIISAARDTDGVDTIQTDATINHGNSGGPLISLKTGKVVGVNSWGLKATDARGNSKNIQNLNFAISAFEVQRTLGVTQPVAPDDFLHPDD